MRSRKLHTLRQHLVIPILAIVLVQAALYGFVFLRMNVMSKMDSNAYEMLYQHASSQRSSLENQMAHRWSNFDQGRAMVLADLEKVLQARGKAPTDLTADSALAQDAVAQAAHSIIHMLRTNTVTGAFLILDAPGLAEDTSGNTRAGLYIRDFDPAAYSPNNSDLLLERAMPALTKSLHLPLDSYWSSVFSFEGQDAASKNFFFHPLRAAKQNPLKTASELGYWSPPFSLSEGDDYTVITYSQPLIASDGTVLGVLGIDLSATYLASQLSPSELGLGPSASYALGQMQGDVFTPMISSGAFLHAVIPGELTLHDSKFEGSFETDIEDGSGDKAIVHPSSLTVYDKDSPFAGDQWVLAAVVSKGRLLSFSNEMRFATYLSILLSLLCAIAALALIGRIVTRPIMLLAHDLKHSDPTKPLTLRKLHIDEIDQLSGAITDLSASVAASASKFSEIIRLTGLPVGVFEYVNGSSSAFCSRTLCDLLGWCEACDTDVALPIEEFERRMEALEAFRCIDDDGSLYHLPGEQTQRWLRIVQLHRDSSLIGSVSDVTHEMLEKQKIQYERDYDPLSRLYNRRAFERQLEAFSHHPDRLKIAALVMWDLDNLKYLNDTYGHDCGDQYIAAFAGLLSTSPAANCVTARRSGDEFYAFFYGYDSREALRGEVDKLYTQISVSSLLLPTGSHYRMRASGGIAYYPDDARSMSELIHYADFAMYSVKHSVKGNLEDFDRAEYEQNSVLLHGQDALDRLLDREQVRYALQPILDVHSISIFGYEMLMRPQMAELPSVGDVLRLARSCSKMRQIERLTLFKGMETFTQLDKAGKLAPGARVFINSVASQRLAQKDEDEFFARFAPYFSRVVLEITENDPYDAEVTRHKIDRIRAHGGKIALDDYGSGYNSDAVMLFLSPDCIKVDLAIIRDIHIDPNRQSMLEYLVSYAGPRGIRVLAEGVETIGELEYLVSHGVDLLQGFYIAKPSFEPDPIAPQILDVVRRAKAQISIAKEEDIL